MTINTNLRGLLGPRIQKALEQLGEDTQAYIVDSLSIPGSVVPFVVAPPGKPSFNWDDELTSGISHETTSGDVGPELVVRSAGVSKYQHPGKVIAADAENGAWWDGWAFDSRSGKWVWISPPHMVAPRPHMRPALEDLRESALPFIAGEVRL